MSRPHPTPAAPTVAIVGFTASGKTGLSLDVAERLGAEIVNTDAMQVYRGMDVGTAKLPPEERRGITHHLLDLRSVRETSTVAKFADQARDVVARLRADGVPAVLVGGSALYIRAILDRFEFPATDVAVRERWEAELERVGWRALHERLAAIDPAAAAKIVPENGRRVVRALEVIEITGGPYAAALPEPTYADPHTVQIGLRIDRPTLDARIELRVQQMFDAGFVAEVERLVGEGLEEGQTARRAIGYREVVAHLEGETSLDEARARTVIATRQFARRQDSWWKRDPRIVWIPYDAADRVEQAMRAVDAVGRS